MLRVTKIISEAGLSPGFEFVPPHALDRGRAVHQAIHLDEEGKLDESSVHPEVAPRLASWRLWRNAVGLVYERGEFEVRTPEYVGHPDILGTINGVRWLLDVKGGAPAPWHGVQTALYAQACTPRPAKRGAVYVTDDGSIAKLVEHRHLSDFSTGNAAVLLACWKKSVGLLT